MTPAQRYLCILSRDVAQIYGITLDDMCASYTETCVEARRVLFVVARDVLCLGPSATAEAFGNSKAAVRHQLENTTKPTPAVKSVIASVKRHAREGFVTYTEKLLKAEAAE